MIAITPMPPTISAIDEMTTSDSRIALRDLIPHLEDRVRVTRSKSFGLSSVRPWRMRMMLSTSRIVSSRVADSSGTTAIMPPVPPNGPLRVFSDPNCLRCAVYGMIAKSSWPRLKPPAAGRLPMTPTIGVFDGADPHGLADRIDAARCANSA